jgi:diadenosine tetraphosphate (Ap4A) HIT family hydrolase
MRQKEFESKVRFKLITLGEFKVEHCSDCALPGYLIVSPAAKAVATLSELPAEALAQLGPVLSTVNRAIQTVIAPVRIYCALFAEHRTEVHFHVFPHHDRVNPALPSRLSGSGGFNSRSVPGQYA